MKAQYMAYDVGTYYLVWSDICIMIMNNDLLTSIIIIINIDKTNLNDAEKLA